MATVQPLRSEPEANAAVPPEPAPIPSLADFLSDREREEMRLADRLAFAMAVEAGQPATPELIERLRRQASADLHSHAFRLLHNQVAEIRQNAVLEHLGRMPRPPGFVKLVLATLCGLLLAALPVAWVALHPPTQRELLDLLGRIGV
ncbi:hypothetical protein M0638_03070 [Roseomonas sp. NAR14]|uniref:Uncharacterized protein n=1 Tax=Roseomonas acroporae TaxID=2937791 RepID=A0A9X1Y393_9PROT|nr:hypothetical protein [Roseomonas acroporae]MCK8783364.1 hypothetical protein [Roseomonas acroporae]